MQLVSVYFSIEKTKDGRYCLLDDGNVSLLWKGIESEGFESVLQAEVIDDPSYL